MTPTTIRTDIGKCILPETYLSMRRVTKGPAAGYFGGRNGIVAVVFEGRTFALKIVDPANSEEFATRYNQIQIKLDELQLRSLVVLKVIRPGYVADIAAWTLKKGKALPVILTPWIAGESLARAVKSRRRKGLPAAILAAFLEIEDAGFQHGDLKPDNIFVRAKGLSRRSSDVVFIDYDGCRFAEIKDYPPDESGSDDYTHPERLDQCFYDERMDDFGKWVILVSVLLIASDRTLLSLGRDDGLIFSASDFGSAARNVFSQLAARGGATARAGDFIRRLAAGPYKDVPRFTRANLTKLGFLARSPIAEKLLAAKPGPFLTRWIERIFPERPVLPSGGDDVVSFAGADDAESRRVVERKPPAAANPERRSRGSLRPEPPNGAAVAAPSQPGQGRPPPIIVGKAPEGPAPNPPASHESDSRPAATIVPSQ